MSYSIGEFSQLTGLGIHTLRYYEAEGLLTPQRNAANRRRYSDGDAAWAEFLKRLKETGMPIREIKRYSTLRAQGEPTLSARLQLLELHRETLKGQISALCEHLEKLDEKIGFYRDELWRTSQTSGNRFP